MHVYVMLISILNVVKGLLGRIYVWKNFNVAGITSRFCFKDLGLGK